MSRSKVTWHLENAGYQSLGPYSHSHSPAALLSKHRCVILLKTWGGVGQKLYERMYEEIKLLSYTHSMNAKYGRDDFYDIKNKLNPRYPDYMVEVTKFYEVDNLAALKSWFPVKKNDFRLLIVSCFLYVSNDCCSTWQHWVLKH